jgi:DNA-binding MarR family transcriptional regulator
MPDIAPRAAASAATPPTLLAVPAYVLSKLGRAGHRLTQEAIADRELLLPHFSVLTTLHDIGPLAQHELADRLSLNRSHLVRYVDDLEGRGAVRRERDPDDRRRQVVSLTPEGGELLAKLREPIRQAQERFMAVLSEDERTVLMGYLVRLLEQTDRTLDDWEL